MVQFGNEFPQNISFLKFFFFVGQNTLAFVRNERNSRSSRRTRREIYQFSCIDRPNGLERSRKVVFWTGPGAKVNECVRSIVS